MTPRPGNYRPYHRMNRVLTAGSEPEPGKPNQNAFVERFNRTFRHEVLYAYVFESLDQVRETSAAWMREYNEERPHDTLDGIPPSVFRAHQTVGSSPLEVSP